MFEMLIRRIKQFFHDVLHWHDGKLGPRWFDGISIHAVCSQCEREVMMDSQGNWFTFGHKPGGEKEE